jgi:hypothetical protein
MNTSLVEHDIRGDFTCIHVKCRVCYGFLISTVNYNNDLFVEDYYQS